MSWSEPPQQAALTAEVARAVVRPVATIPRPTIAPPPLARWLAADQIALADTTFQCRAQLRLGDLPQRLAREGQLTPLVVRPGPDGSWQIVCGFRRAHAMRQLRWTQVLVIARADLDDHAAWRLALTDNAGRRSCTDLDRALTVRRSEAMGLKGDEIALLMGLTQRQKNNVRSLLDLSAVARAALEDHAGTFTATHALRLRQLQRQHPAVDKAAWILRIVAERLSVAGLVRGVQAQHGSAREREVTTLFDARQTDLDARCVQLLARRLDVDGLTLRERNAISRDLRLLTALLERKSISAPVTAPEAS